MIEQETGSMTSSPPITSTGILDSLKERVNLHGVVQKAKLSRDKIYEALLYGGIGLICGYLLKRYGSYVVTVVAVCIALWGLQQYDVVHMTINWDRMYDLFGIQIAPEMTADTAIGIAWEWMKVNMVISVSYLVGFFIGLKLG